MNSLSSRLVVYLVGAAAIFVILFGIRGSASIINPILLAAVITITVQNPLDWLHHCLDPACCPGVRSVQSADRHGSPISGLGIN